MKKLKMIPNQKLTFEEGCNKYLEYCRQRNLREETINHYNQNINLLVSDLAKQVDEISVPDKFYGKKRILLQCTRFVPLVLIFLY